MRQFFAEGDVLVVNVPEDEKKTLRVIVMCADPPLRLKFKAFMLMAQWVFIREVSSFASCAMARLYASLRYSSSDVNHSFIRYLVVWRSCWV